MPFLSLGEVCGEKRLMTVPSSDQKLCEIPLYVFAQKTAFSFWASRREEQYEDRYINLSKSGGKGRSVLRLQKLLISQRSGPAGQTDCRESRISNPSSDSALRVPAVLDTEEWSRSRSLYWQSAESFLIITHFWTSRLIFGFRYQMFVKCSPPCLLPIYHILYK